MSQRISNARRALREAEHAADVELAASDNVHALRYSLGRELELASALRELRDAAHEYRHAVRRDHGHH